MKIIFISDIHSNWHYLKQIKENIEKEKANYIYFLGDAIGYYNEPNKVLDWLREMDVICIKGNHEQYFLNELNYDDELKDIYRVESNKNIISLENKKFIESWEDKIETTINNKKFIILHGDVDSSENHVYEPFKIDREILKKYDYYVYGHTHIPLIQYQYGCCIINPGSIGQPRDYTSLPSYIIVNLCTNEVRIKKIEVEKDSYISNLKTKLFDKKVIDILKRKNNGKD